VVYRIDIENIEASRLKQAGSGLEGSSEFLISDLEESELELLFLDFEADGDFKKTIHTEYHEYKRTSCYSIQPEEVLSILERRCSPPDVIQQSVPTPEV
jgi:hypothetical protein